MAGRESVVCGNACLIVINHFRKLPGNFQKDVDLFRYLEVVGKN